MDAPPPPKRPRLSMACNECRRRKVKCDAEYPKCRNCRLRDDECLTEDPRRHGEKVVREWIEGPAAPVNEDFRQHHDQLPSPGLPSGPSPSVAGVSTNAQSTHEAFGISPVHQGQDMTFNLDHETNRIKMMGASSSQTLMKSLDVYLKSADRKPLSTHFIHAMRHSEESVIPTVTEWPPLPGVAACEQHMDVFFKRIHILFPLFDIDDFKRHVRNLTTLPVLQRLPPEQIPLLASAYLVISLGIDEAAQKPTPEGERYLQAASCLLSHIILMPYLPSVQCLLLFAIAYRGRNKDGVGWQMLGLAVRIAHTLGLHRFSSGKPSSQHGIQVKYEQLFQARIWGICCCLEKTMQLESGRPSSIVVVDRDQMMGPDQLVPRHLHDFLQWHVGLAEFQSQISHHIYGHAPGARSTRQLLLDTAKLDAALLAWANEIPTEFRPGPDLFCSNKDFHAAAHLSMHYHQAMIALHRAALISPVATFESEVSAHCTDHDSQFRLKKGESICVNSARSIARLTVELVDRKVNSRLLTVSCPLLACIVLSVYLMKTSSSRMQASDLELLYACAESTSEQCLSCGMDPRFARAPIAMYEEVKACLETAAAAKTVNGRGRLKDAHHDATGMTILPSESQMATGLPMDQAASSNGDISRSTSFMNDQSQQMHLPQSCAPGDAQYDESLLQGGHDGSHRPFDDTGPFTGLNVEDLWNWMLVTDVTGGNDDLQWVQQAAGPF